MLEFVSKTEGKTRRKAKRSSRVIKSGDRPSYNARFIEERRERKPSIAELYGCNRIRTRTTTDGGPEDHVISFTRLHLSLPRKVGDSLADPLLFPVSRMGQTDAGFTAVEIMMVVAIAGIVAAVSVPSISGAMQQYALNGAREIVAAEIRLARFTAVSTNRTVRVRFDCPGSDQLRIVEVVGDLAVDSASDRCSETTYPFPDQDPNTEPNADGRIVWLPQGARFATIQDLEITPRGRITPLAGCPTCAPTAPPATIAVTNGADTRTIAVSASGRVELP